MSRAKLLNEVVAHVVTLPIVRGQVGGKGRARAREREPKGSGRKRGRKGEMNSNISEQK
jgi:hypothetical protein